MHFGLFNLMTQRDKSKTPREIYAEMADQVRLAEELFGEEVLPLVEKKLGKLDALGVPLAGVERDAA